MKGKNIFVNDNKEYTFEEYTEATFENQTSIQSLFNGSIFKDSNVNHSNFYLQTSCKAPSTLHH